MRGRAGKSTLIVIGVALVAFVVLIVAPNYRVMTYRTREAWYHQNMREFAIEIDGLSVEQRSKILGKPYWGPLTPQVLQSMYLKPDRYIDPFNHDARESEWHEGPEYDVDRGAKMRIRGGDLQFYCDGSGFWMIIGRGPDGRLQLTQALLDANLDSLKKSYPEDYTFLALYQYDPTNGIVSTGDVIRKSEP